MAVFILRRLGQGLLALAMMTLVVFLLSRATGNALDLLVPESASAAERAALAKHLGLDRPLLEQFGVYVWSLLQGDFGVSLVQKVPVSELLVQRFPNSVRMIVPALIVGILVGIPMGVVSATTRYRSLRWSLGLFSAFGIAAPLFWLGIVLILLFSVEWQLLPSSRMGGPEHYVLPVATLAIFLAAGLMRLVRGSLLEVLQTEYVKLARLEGLSERKIIWKYALKNSVTSAVAFIGVYFSVLITGNIVIERVFAWPGLGQLVYDSILIHDYPVIQGVVLLAGAVIIVVRSRL
jgi:ABC-type dipeptide/oligopeptide/nickel transport system permease component